MPLLYSTGLRIYYFIILVYSLFNTKAEKWISGRKGIIGKLKNIYNGNHRIIWFHAASLGEFEQGRPVIEEIRKQYPKYKILLTFFSPSGYEVRKNYPGADFILYLPLDTKRNAARFIELANPEIAVFIKYEFWFYYLKALKNKNIPVYLISSIFRKNQVFFKWYGKWYRKMLMCFTHLFVQNEESAILLKKIKINNYSISGDTRFDRVYELSKKAKKIECVERFINDKKIIICGSTWPKDENLITRFINSSSDKFKFIIAPHEIEDSHIKQIELKIKKTCMRFSLASNENLELINVLIIDNIGILSSLYKYGEIAYIGGGFGLGIHNILEAVTYGIPVIFGPNYSKFNEAVELIQHGGAFSISSFNELITTMNLLIKNNTRYNIASEVCRKYIEEKVGATQKILHTVF